MSVLLEAVKLKKSYRVGAHALEVLRGVTLQIQQGELAVIVGPSGAGKSTLLHLLGGLDRPTSGEVRFDGKNLSRLKEREVSQLRSKAFGFVFQFYHLVPELTALENVMLPGRVGGDSAFKLLRQRAFGCLDDVGLGHRAEHRPTQLSGGEQQRVAIARALVMEPPVLLCDEPTGNLDSKTGAEVIDVIFAAHRKRSMSLVLVTHEAKIAAQAQRRIELEDGQIKKSG